MSKTLKIIIIVVVILTLLAGGYYFIFLRGEDKIIDNDDQANNQQPYLPPNQGNNQNNQPTLTPQPQPKIVSEETKIKNFSRSFSERFGSYSNQSDYANLEDLMPVMTENMQTWAENYIKQQRKQDLDTSVYKGTTTKALSVQILEQDETNAQIKVSTQRIQKGQEIETKTYYQDLNLNLVKQGGSWIVDSAEWQVVK